MYLYSPQLLQFPFKLTLEWSHALPSLLSGPLVGFNWVNILYLAQSFALTRSIATYTLLLMSVSSLSTTLSYSLERLFRIWINMSRSVIWCPIPLSLCLNSRSWVIHSSGSLSVLFRANKLYSFFDNTKMPEVLGSKRPCKIFHARNAFPPGYN
jgi:hypothetical protein